MPTDDIQRLVAGTAAAPASFTIPGNGQIRPKAIFATYDGTGAAASFLPVLKVISDGGKTVGIYPTGITMAAGGSADISWFPGVAGEGLPSPGSILQTYGALNAAADFNFNSNLATASNWPANPTFTKLSSTSLLLFSMNCDVQPGAAPDVITWLLTVDGNDLSNVALHVAQNASIITGSWPRILTDAPWLGTPLPAGPHTINLAMETAQSHNCTLLSKAACDMEIIEYEANITT